MNVGDRVQVIKICSAQGKLGTIVKEETDMIALVNMAGKWHVQVDSEPGVWYFKDADLQVMSAFNYAPNPVPPAPKPITFRFTKNPVAHVTLVPDGPRWIIRDCHDDKYRGMSYDSMEEFLMIHNDSGVYESTGLPPKQCKHQWKERILFVSVEEYCVNCEIYRQKKAS